MQRLAQFDCRGEGEIGGQRMRLPVVRQGIGERRFDAAAGNEGNDVANRAQIIGRGGAATSVAGVHEVQAEIVARGGDAPGERFAGGACGHAEPY